MCVCVFVIAGTHGGHALTSDDRCPLEKIYSLWRARELDHRPRGLDLSRVVVDDYLCSKHTSGEQRTLAAGITMLHSGYRTAETLSSILFKLTGYSF